MADTTFVDGTVITAAWLNDINDFVYTTVLTNYAALASPSFTGVPTAPTATVDTSTTQLATTAFVVNQGYAKIVSPVFTGVPAVPTAAVDTNTTQIASTSYVINQGYAKLISPTFTTPTLGVASATSVNKVVITSPATSATLALANGSSLATSGANSLTLTSTGTTNVTLPTSGTLLGTAAAVTVAQGGTGLGTLTANNVILGNGTSNPTFVAPGTSGNVLTSNGTTWTSAAAAGGGGGAMVLLSTGTASNSTRIDLETTFNSTYDQYLVVIAGVVPISNGVTLNCQMKINGSYDTGANYSYHVQVPSNSAVSYDAITSSSATYFVLSHTLSNSSGPHYNAWLKVFNPTSAQLYKALSWEGIHVGSSSGVSFETGVGVNSGTAALTGLRFTMSSGNISTGTFRLYGISNS